MESAQELTIQEAMARCDYSRSHLTGLVARGVLKGRKVADVWVIDADALQAYLAQPHKSGPKTKRQQGQSST